MTKNISEAPKYWLSSKSDAIATYVKRERESIRVCMCVEEEIQKQGSLN